MGKLKLILGLVSLFAWVLPWSAAAQTGAEAPPAQFTTLSIKPVNMPTAAEVQANPTLELMRVEERNPQRIHLREALGNLIMTAYGVSFLQMVTTPAQLDALRQWYDVTGITDAPATRMQMRAMLREALRSRFQVTVHHQPKEGDLFAMVVDDGGLKLEKQEGSAGVTRAPDELFAGSNLDQLIVFMNSAAQVGAVGMKYLVIDQTGLTGSSPST